MSENDTARPRFYVAPVENVAKTRDAGRPIFDEVEMVEVRMPGDRLTVFVDEVQDKHRERWPDLYAAFKRGEARAASGTPLEHWPIVTTGKVAELKAMNILSVEELASVPDNVIAKMGPGARDLREQARAFIATAEGGASAAAMASEVARLREMVEQLTQARAPSAAPAPQAVTEAEEEAGTKALTDCSDDELKAYIKAKTGEAPRGNVSRETLIKRATEIATQAA